MSASSSAYLVYGVILGGGNEDWNFEEAVEDDSFEEKDVSDVIYATLSRVKGAECEFSGHHDYSTAILSVHTEDAYGYGISTVDPQSLVVTEEMQNSFNAAVSALSAQGFTLKKESQTPEWLLFSTYG